MYDLAREYYVAHGDLNVPSNYVTPEGVNLGTWVNRQRRIRDGKARGSLTPERLRMLDEMGMIWDVDAYRWEQNFAAAEAYWREHGDLRYVKRYTTPDGVKLGTWLIYQREKHSRGELDAEKVARLNAIGMVW